MSFLRSGIAAAVLAATMLVPAAGTSLAVPLPPTSTGTLVGTVTCGPSEEAPAAQARVAVEGIDLSARVDPAGKFSLVGVPTEQLLTIDALADPQGAVATSRYDVSVEPGQTLDIGNLDLVVCPSPVPADVFPQDQLPADTRDQP
jgi:hypothetical protein